MGNIVVGLDDSKSAQAAARWTAEQATQTGSRVVAVHAVPKSELWSLSAMQFNADALLRELTQLLEGTWVAPLRKAGVEYTTLLVRGDPALELLKTAKRVNATMLVLGSKSHSGLADLVVGGTVHKVINRANLPVVLVPPSVAPKKAVPAKKAAGSGTTRVRGA